CNSSADGSADGWVYSAGTPALTNLNQRPVPGTNLGYAHNTVYGPVLDGGPMDPIVPLYDLGYRSPLPLPTGSTWIELIHATDSPGTGGAVDLTDPLDPVILTEWIRTQTIDVRYDFRMYLVWQYGDGSIYALATIDWYANFF